MSFPPTLFLIGAQKAGTTFLASILNQHPDICVSNPKEPAYFTKNIEKGLDWYRSRFASVQSRYLLDATPGYSAAPLDLADRELRNSPFCNVPDRIYELSPEARILYIVREPVRRAYSSYWHNVRAGHESRTFLDAISEDSFYLRISRYFDQLSLYEEFFDRKQIFVLKFEELVTDPEETVARCLEFLEIPNLESIETQSGKNQSFAYTGILAILNQKLAKYGGLNRISKLLQPAVPPSMKKWIYKNITHQIPELDPSIQAELATEFRAANSQLASAYGLNLDDWSEDLGEHRSTFGPSAR